MLEYRQVDISYHRDSVLKNISVAFPKGCITSLIGPNGSGKTTLLQCLIGSAQVTAGSVLLEGEDFFAKPPKERAKLLAFLPQTRTVLPSLSVRTLVSHGRFPYMGFGRKESPEDARIIASAMEYAKVTEYAAKSVETLSGGIRQRVFLAMVLAQDTPYILLDEPTTYLDIKAQLDFLNLVKGLKNQGKTVIMVLHDINQALDVSDHLVIMKDCGIAAVGPKKTCAAGGMIENIFDVTCKRFEEAGRTYYFFQ